MGNSPAICDDCEKCLLCYQDIKHPGLGGRGNLNDPILVGIGEAPGPDEDIEGTIFIGKAGKELELLLGDKLPLIYLTNALKCLPLKRFDDPSQGFRTPEALEIFSCRSLLFKELKAFDPNKVILMPMGAIAYQSIFGFPPDPGILSVAGMPMRVKINNTEFLVVPNVHPSWVARAPKEREGKFRGILNRAWGLAKEGNLSTVSIESKGADYEILNPNRAIQELEFILANKENLPYIIVDLETTSLDYWKAKILMINFAHSLNPKGFSIPLRVTNENHHPDKYPYQVPIIPWDITPEQVSKIIGLFIKILESVPLVGHNLKYDLLILLWNKWIANLDNVVVFDDTMILLHLIYNQKLGNLKLKDCCKKLFNIVDDWDKKVTSYLELFRLKEDKTNYALLPTSILGEYGALDAYYNRKLHDHLLEDFPKDLTELREFITYLTIVLTESEISGIALDEDVHKFLANTYGDMLDKMFDKALSFPMVKKYIEANIGSVREANEKPRKKKKLSEEEMVAEVFTMTKRLALVDVMYDKEYLGMPVLKKTKGGKDRSAKAPSTDQEAVELLHLYPKLNEDQRIFIDNLADYRTIDKLKSTYVDPVMNQFVDNLYRQEFMIPGTITGRLCLVGSTKISLLNGEEIEIDKLPINEKIYLYGCLQDGGIIPVEAISIGETKKVTIIAEVILDNGCIERCTLDHSWMLRDGSYKEAQYLNPGDSLMPLYRETKKIGEYKDYEVIINNKNGKKILTHKLVANYFNRDQKLEVRKNTKDKYLVIHHDDFNRKNNYPKNLIWMGEHDHWILHASLGKADLLLKYVCSDEGRKKSSERLLKRWSDLEYREKQIKILRNNGLKSWESEDRRNKQVQIGRNNAHFMLTPKFREKSLKLSIPINSKRWKELWGIDEKWRQDCINRIKEIWNNEEYREKMSSIAKDTIRKQLQDPIFVEKSRLAAIKCGTEVFNRVINKLCPKCGKIFVKQAALNGHLGYCGKGLNNKKDYLNDVVNQSCPKCGKTFLIKGSYIGHVNSCKHNHRVVSVKIIKLENPISVYEIAYSKTNNFALSSGVFVHNSSGFHTLPRESDIKRMYTSRWREKGGLILGFDFSQLELRVLACLSQEPKMIEAFINHVDIHAKTGGEIAGKSWDKITPDERSIGKTTNFAIVYGKTADTLKDDLHVSRERAQQIIDSVLGGYDKVASWMEARHKELENIGGIKTIFGREIPIPEFYLQGRTFELEAQRKSVNYPIQSTASDLANSGLVRLYKKFKMLHLQSIILAAIHDAAYSDLKPGELFVSIAMMKKILEAETMRMYPWIICPIEIDISMGTSLGSSIKLEVEELEENRALLKGKGLRKDFNMLMNVGQEAYNMKFYLEKEKPVDSDYFTLDRVLGDTVEWKGRLEVSNK